MRGIFLFLLIIPFVSCKIDRNLKHSNFSNIKLPSENGFDFNVLETNDSIVVNIKNKINLAVFFYSGNSSFDSVLKFRNYKKLLPLDSILMKFNKTEFQSFEASSINIFEKSIEKPILNLPFLKNSKYQILQGYNSPFSHNLLNNKFAIDIQMPVGTKICAAAEGVVVKYVKDYATGGFDLKYKGFDNFIWIYHPQWNVISSYAHLKQNGVLVKVGDFVKANQPIALSGNTGYSTEPHLHFHVLKINDEMQYESIPFDFLEGYSGFDLKKDAFVKK